METHFQQLSTKMGCKLGERHIEMFTGFTSSKWAFTSPGCHALLFLSGSSLPPPPKLLLLVFFPQPLLSLQSLVTVTLPLSLLNIVQFFPNPLFPRRKHVFSLFPFFALSPSPTLTSASSHCPVGHSAPHCTVREPVILILIGSITNNIYFGPLIQVESYRKRLYSA